MDLRKIATRISSRHGSGDSSQPGGYDLSVVVREVKVYISGEVSGKDTSGTITLYGEPGNWSGHEYEPDEGSFDITEDPDILKIVLDAADEEASG